MIEAKLQRRIQRYGWDKASTFYEQYWKDQLHPAQEQLLNMADLQPGEQVLDVACGTGLVTFPAADAVGTDGEVYGTDLSENMLDQLWQEAVQRHYFQVRVARMDAENLEFDEGTFDAALCALGLMYVPDPLKAMQEIYRTLQPGGRAVVAVWGARSACGWADIFPIVDSRVKSDVCPMFFQLGTGDALGQTVEAAGFSDVTIERMSTLLPYETPEDACGAAFAGGPVALAYSKFDEVTKGEAHAEYVASIEPFRHDHGYQIPGEFVIVRGRK